MLRLTSASCKWLLVLALLGFLGCGGNDAPSEKGPGREPTVRVKGGGVVTENLGKGSVERAREHGVSEAALRRDK